MLSPSNLNRLRPFIREMGYDVLDFGEPKLNKYRPRVKNLKGNVNDNLVIFVDAEKITIFDYSGQVKESVTVRTDNWEIDKEGLKKHLKQIEGEKSQLQAEFRARFEALKDKNWNDNTHPVATEKKIKLLNSFTSKGTLYVPFFCDGKVVGCQTRIGSKKRSITGSTTRGAYNILQEGVQDKVLRYRLAYLAESYTTACEIAEAKPDAFVACCAGISQQLRVFETLRGMYPDIFLILVLDKTRHNDVNETEQQVQLNVSKNGIPHIQLDKMDISLGDMTDFNDFALKRGKYAVKKEVQLQTSMTAPFAPEVVGQTVKEYEVVSPIDGKIHQLRKSRLNSEIKDKASPAFWEIFNELHKPTEVAGETVRRWCALESRRNTGISPRGLGIFQDGDGYVANLECGRYTSVDGKVAPTVDIKPLNKHIYLSISDEVASDISDHFLTMDALRKVKTLWETQFNRDPTHLLGVLGWAVQACYASFSPFRTHLWLTGASGSGKSAIATSFISGLFNGITLFTDDTTVAGIGQRLSPENGTHNSPIICFDEAGSDTANKATRMEGIIKMAREASANEERTVSLRGTAEQRHREYRKRYCFALMSTRCSLKDPQDVSRFITLDLEGALKDTDPRLFQESEKQIRRLNPAFLNAVIAGAGKFEGFVNEAHRLLEATWSMLTTFTAHRKRSLAACIAGVAILYDQVGVESPVQTAFEGLGVFIKEACQEHLALIGEGNDVVKDLLRFRFRRDGLEYTLLQALKDDSSGEYWRDYGIRYTQLHGKSYLDIKRGGFDLDQLVNSRQATTNRLRDVKSRLREAPEGVKYTMIRDKLQKKRVHIYRALIPEEYL